MDCFGPKTSSSLNRKRPESTDDDASKVSLGGRITHDFSLVFLLGICTS